MEHTVYSISIVGMTCGGCSSRLTRVLESSPGILKAIVSHADGTGIVTTSPEITEETVFQIVNSAGFEAHA